MYLFLFPARSRGGLPFRKLRDVLLWKAEDDAYHDITVYYRMDAHLLCSKSGYDIHWQISHR